jgi:hypothetical protein
LSAIDTLKEKVRATNGEVDDKDFDKIMHTSGSKMG